MVEFSRARANVSSMRCVLYPNAARCQHDEHLDFVDTRSSIARGPTIDARVGNSVTAILVIDEDRMRITETRHDANDMTSLLELLTHRFREPALDIEAVGEPLVMNARR